MQKKSRIRRKIVKWQIEDQGANPLTPKGRKWIKKELKKLDQKKLRKALESQNFEALNKSTAYWDHVESFGGKEVNQANPDLMEDDLDNTVDGD